jgi:hypothetical protein
MVRRLSKRAADFNTTFQPPDNFFLPSSRLLGALDYNKLMSAGLVVPRWFRIVYRLLATVVIAGLGGLVLADHGIRDKWLAMWAAEPLAECAFPMVMFGPPLFCVSAWIGVGNGWVRALNASFYTMFFVGCLFALFWFVP